MWIPKVVLSCAWIFSRAAKPLCTILWIIASTKKRNVASTIKKLCLHFSKQPQKDSRYTSEMWNRNLPLRFRLLRTLIKTHHLTLLSTSKISTKLQTSSKNGERKKKTSTSKISKTMLYLLTHWRKADQEPARWWQAYFLPAPKTTSSCIQPICVPKLLSELSKSKCLAWETSLKVDWRRPQICLIWIKNLFPMLSQ